VNVVDDLLRRPEHGDGPTIGTLLATDRNDVVVEYALRGYDTPLAVSTYTTHRALPGEVCDALPSPEEFSGVVKPWRRRNPAVSSSSGAASATLTYRGEHGGTETVVVGQELARAVLEQLRSPAASNPSDSTP